MKRYLVCVVTAILIGPMGCQQKGPVERAGERLDEVIDNVKDGDSPLKEKGRMEKIGESIDKSIKKVDEKLQ